MAFRLRYGFKTSQQQTTFDEIAAVWAVADQIDALEHGWLFDHFAPVGGDSLDGPVLEGWSCLAALAARTERLRFGMMTSGNTYRYPAVHAHIASTVDNISNGRVEFGMGAGWNVYEHESMGIPLGSDADRIRRLGEAAALTKLLWTQEITNFDGKYYQLKEARLNPKPVQTPHPPLVIGGSGEKLTLRVVAEHADIWNYVGGGLEQLAHKLNVLRGHCDAIGRDPATLELSSQVRVNFDDIDASVTEAQGLIDAGVTHLIFMLTPPYRPAQIERVAAELLPQLTPSAASNGVATGA